MSQLAELPPAPPGYEQLRLLGSGGFGAVTLARHNALGRLVAIKYLRPEALVDPDALNRFRREAVILAGLENPYVVRVYDVQFADPQPFIIMEYVPGEPLDALLERGCLSVGEMLTVLDDVAVALEAAHAQGIAHRDVKPANVFVLPDRRAKLGDFGIARISSNTNLFRTSADSIGGTPAYLPPEVALGTHEPEARSDTYSFAVMAYEMLTGRLPFVDRGIMGLIAAHAQEPVPAPETIRPGFPPAASRALLKALSKDPAERPAPTALVAELRAVHAAAWPEVIRDERRAPQDATRHVKRTLQAPTTPGAPLRRRKRKWPVVAALTAIVGAAVAAVVLAFGGNSSPSAAPLQVSSVAVTASAPAGRCPSMQWTFTAAIATNGSAGSLRLHWIRPDGQPTADQEVALRQGQRTANVVLRFSVTGSRPLHGTATLQLLAPAQSTDSSPPVTYSC